MMAMTIRPIGEIAAFNSHWAAAHALVATATMRSHVTYKAICARASIVARQLALSAKFSTETVTAHALVATVTSPVAIASARRPRTNFSMIRTAVPRVTNAVT